MKRLFLIAATPLLATLTACGPSNDVTVTADNNVVLNDAQANYAFTNDDELPTNQLPPDLNSIAPDAEVPDNATHATPTP